MALHLSFVAILNTDLLQRMKRYCTTRNHLSIYWLLNLFYITISCSVQLSTKILCFDTLWCSVYDWNSTRRDWIVHFNIFWQVEQHYWSNRSCIISWVSTCRDERLHSTYDWYNFWCSLIVLSWYHFIFTLSFELLNMIKMSTNQANN